MPPKIEPPMGTYDFDKLSIRRPGWEARHQREKKFKEDQEKKIEEYFEKNKLRPDIPFDEQKKIVKGMWEFRREDVYDAIDVLSHEDQLKHIAELKALNISTITESRGEIARIYQQQTDYDRRAIQDAVRGIPTPMSEFPAYELDRMNKMISQAELHLNNLATKEIEIGTKKQLAIHAEERQKEQAIFEAKEVEQLKAYQAKYQEMHLKRQQEADAKAKAEEAKVKAEHEKVKINQQMAISRLNTAVLGRNNSYYRIERDQLVGRQKLPVNRGSYDFYQDFLKRSV